MAGVNKVIIIGNLGRDPEIRYSQQGLAIVNFPVATSEQWTDKNSGERQEKTEWHRIVAFGKPAETLEKYLNKGSQIYIEGRLQTSTYDKEGQTHYSTEIVVNNFQFLGGRSGKGPDDARQQGGQPQQQGGRPQQQNNTKQMTSGGTTQAPHPDPSVYNTIPDDDIPF